MIMPCLVYVGDEDTFYEPAKECARHLPNASFVVLPDCNHVEALLRSDVVLPHVMTFWATVNRIPELEVEICYGLLLFIDRYAAQW